ncbi:hypothetical protein EYF80_059646 [Liparis tanakae]|uniref:Uncharacterized protein n=1 Tax=Liparis tanakae TaxID=230148 RepID=A0A4Z2EN80_9TELE|nr:hypothetical protein EYF80_059646 [Liparis tanakae]
MQRQRCKRTGNNVRQEAEHQTGS